MTGEEEKGRRGSKDERKGEAERRREEKRRGEEERGEEARRQRGGEEEEGRWGEGEEAGEEELRFLATRDGYSTLIIQYWHCNLHKKINLVVSVEEYGLDF